MSGFSCAAVILNWPAAADLADLVRPLSADEQKIVPIQLSWADSVLTVVGEERRAWPTTTNAGDSDPSAPLP
ncbi:uncharacterized protein F5Z01DRAFT_663843 [Emericellopsis atlantica]|uniref:Uncharacterized protein n=1 Tax=Emericellopsis atlantica TaxID=2614577 RepID=A0A9P8CLD8_9HYPO|nr:uncharacterized protein F5Z01DRAFT_663843 [Emericellopsis atlantica]KAG9251293.1 hypothetical protein F5Z01DRAFT_663843 [Emericellopsis atlantica]